MSCMAAAKRVVRPLWRSMPRSKRTPKSEDKAPPRNRHGRYGKQWDEKTVVQGVE